MTQRGPHTIGAVKGPKASAKVAEVWEGLAKAHTSMTAALERDMVPEGGMPLAWYEVLLHLSRVPDAAMRYQDLAKVAGITNSGASRRTERPLDLDPLADGRLAGGRADSAVEAKGGQRHDAGLEREALLWHYVEKLHLVVLAGARVHHPSGA